MGEPVRTILVSLIALCLFAPAGAGATAEPQTLRAYLVAELEVRGVDAAAALAAPFVVETSAADGTQTERVTTLEAYLTDSGLGQLLLSTQGTGVAGSPEVLAGDFFHLYLNIVFGGDARAYRVHDSAVVPATPAVAPPAPADTAVFDVGGPLRSIDAGGYLLGIHSVGTLAGSNVDTHGAGPFVPVATAGSVDDTSLDFTGHAVVTQGQTCFFGICIAVGQLLADGVAVWNEPAHDVPAVP